MKPWQQIRLARPDITDYVIHFTKFHLDFHQEKTPPGRPHMAEPFVVLGEILSDGYIIPTVARIKSKTTGTSANTVRGPEPAVCLTEQPISAVVRTKQVIGSRYSGFGIAYHKYALFSNGGRPVIYGSKSILGKQLYPTDEGYEEGKEIFTGGLPRELQYLFVQYKPTVEYFNDHPIDWTWEREWRIKCKAPGLPVFLEKHANVFKKDSPVGAIVVERDEHVDKVKALLADKATQGVTWAAKLTRIVSLETAARMLEQKDERYARIETWPD